MGYSVVQWKVTPDTWSNLGAGEASQEKFLICTGQQVYTIVEGELVPLSITQPIRSAEYLEFGFDSLNEVSQKIWDGLVRPVHVLYWSEKDDVAGVDIEVGIKHFPELGLEFAIPPYTPIDGLERPLKVLTYTDSNDVPLLKGQYDMVGVGTRIMKRGE